MCYSLWYNVPTVLSATGGQHRGYIIFHYIFLRLAKQSQFIPLQNVVYIITIHFLVRKIFTFYLNDVLLFNLLNPSGFCTYHLV